MTTTKSAIITLFAQLGTLHCVHAAEVSVRALRWDGTSLAGTWAGAGEGVVHFTVDGTAQAEDIDGLAAVDFSAPIRTPSGAKALYLSDGGVLLGELTGSAEDAVVARTALGEVTIAWNRLSALRLAEPTQFVRAQKVFDESMESRSPSQDVLISRDPADVKVLQGRLERLDPKGGSFFFSGESRTFQTEKIFGIVFAAGAAGAQPPPATVELADGSSLSGRIRPGDASQLRILASFGSDFTIPIGDVRRLTFRSDRVQYLSELKPANEKTEGIVHAPWPVAVNSSVSGRPLSIAGRRFDRGLGMHSRAEVSYALEGHFEKFAATIGIDDHVRPLGSVVMRVVGDGQTLFDSGTLTGSDPPRDILVDVGDVRVLTLLVDYGEGVDVSDHADWGDARLLRPGGSGKSTQKDK